MTTEVLYKNGNDTFKVTLDEEGVIDQIFKLNADGEYNPLPPKHPKIKVFLNNHNAVAVHMSFKRFHIINPIGERALKRLTDALDIRVKKG